MTLNSATILVVDDEVGIRNTLSPILLDEGYKVITASCGETALSLLKKESIDLIFLDIWLPNIDGIEVLKRIKEMEDSIPVIMMSGHGTVKTAVDAVRLGAFDFLEKPLSMEKILVTVKNVLKMSDLSNENKQLKRSVMTNYKIIGESLLIKNLRKRIELAAPASSSVLIFGKNGTGKELVAREIHLKSRRSSKPFVELNCAAIPEELIESELFGHEKGAFTGAHMKKRGKFDLADGGTLFLDEIGDMSLKTQAKILRILQEQVFERVGGNRSISVDVRIIAATNKSLLEEIKLGNFREDLYYRLNVIPFEVPKLTDRKEDITDSAMKAFLNYSWPGNIRELKNVVEHIIIMAQEDKITSFDIPAYLNPLSLDKDSVLTDVFTIPDFKTAKDRFEREYIKRKLKEFSGNVSKTAENISVERSHLHKKIKQYDITN